MDILSSLNRVLFDIATVPMKQVSDTVAHVYHIVYFARPRSHVYQDYRNTRLHQTKDDLDSILLHIGMTLKGALLQMNGHTLALELADIVQDIACLLYTSDAADEHRDV